MTTCQALCMALIVMLSTMLLGLPAACDSAEATAPSEQWEIRDGRFYDDGEWVFLKIAKPLCHFPDPDHVQLLIDGLDILQDKGYNCIELICYWHHFDPEGDGEISVSLEPLNRVIRAIRDRGMYVSVGVENYAVGGGVLPPGFWERHPDAVAINSDGEEVYDVEYGFGSRVPSQFSPEYLEASRRFIRNLMAGVENLDEVLYFETSVEPQYMGHQRICYSDHARKAYEEWVTANDIADAPPWPDTFPVPEEFIANPVWNQFRAESLAGWVSGDMRAIREVAGEDAWIAVDYLESGGPEMPNRLGDPVTFLKNLDRVEILQVNWHWNKITRSPNTVAYENVRKVDRDWAVSEHMTFNGSDYAPEEAHDVLHNTLEHGTRFGWEFVNALPATADPFTLYNDDWSDKPLIAEVHGNWDYWQEQIHDK